MQARTFIENKAKEKDQSIKDAAAAMGLSKVTLFGILSGKLRITANVALKLEAWSGKEAEYFVIEQAIYDVRFARLMGETKNSMAKTIKEFIENANE